jgi:phosphatidate phosphatase APP1
MKKAYIEKNILKMLEEEATRHNDAWEYMMEAHNKVFNSTDIDGVEVWVRECRKRDLDVYVSNSKIMLLKQVLKLFDK